MSERVAKGQCLCGAVQFEFDLPAKWCANCHCSMCRRAHGAPFVTWVGVEGDRFRLVAGEPELGSPVSARGTSISRNVTPRGQPVSSAFMPEQISLLRGRRLELSGEIL